MGGLGTMNTRTNIKIDDQLIAKAMARAGVRTKKAAVEAALRAYVRKPDYTGLLELAGSGVLADDYDPSTLFLPVEIDAPVAAASVPPALSNPA